MDNQFRIQNPKLDDFIIRYSKNKTLLKKTEGKNTVPLVRDFYGADSEGNVKGFSGHYLFSIDGKSYFLDDSEIGEAIEGFEFVGNRSFRDLEDMTQRLGGVTAAHIAHWESLNKFCGRCGHAMTRSNTERAQVCTNCNNIVYPRISPVVIVAVHNGNKLLMARNLDHPDKSRLFLISGFVEIGESLEQAAEREVMEEAGLHVKNIRYFSSQPWAFSDSLIAGFTAELDGSDKIQIQENEIETATWIEREDIPEYDTSVSISGALIESFRNQHP